nr:uncharacterized protein LOC128691693 [Cherax quadricarinatus]XP_053636538.1 uncharacterized protein LOC128691693 [Cherax quadricarinatus]XP_053636539.1 uncharacterized protein LOC128691693 [Cherax quadricarinatus]XP_053636540.1 uncharacterized protein LOC128691693 [Cherax quadricarinatus]
MKSEEKDSTLLLSSQSDNIYIFPDAHETHSFLFNVYVNPTKILLFLGGNILCLLVAICFLAVYRSAERGRQNGEEEETEPRKILTPPGGWLRPVSNTEMFAASAAFLGTGSTATVLWLSSLQSIRPEDVKQALSIIAQRIHVLQLCVAWRWFRPWLRRMKNVVVDFSVDTGDAISVYYQQMRTPYNISQGPLWRARLVPQPQAAAGSHQAVLVLAIHHVITDGFTNMIISRDFMEVLNAIMTGRSYNTPTRYNIPAITNDLLSMRNYIYCFKEVLLTTYKSIARMFIFSHPETKVAFTKVLYKDFSAETTQELLRHCKEANVSIHSSIVAAAYLALLRTAQKHLKVKKDSLSITYDDSVNMRRFFPSIYKESVGFMYLFVG